MEVDGEEGRVGQGFSFDFGKLSELVDSIHEGGDSSVLETIDWDAFKGHGAWPGLSLMHSAYEKQIQLACMTWPPQAGRHTRPQSFPYPTCRPHHSQGRQNTHHT